MYADAEQASTARAATVRAHPAYGVQVFVLVFAGYYFGTKVGFALTFHPNPISVLWPPNAIVFAALLLVPTHLWWLIIAAALPAHLLAQLQGGVPIVMVLSWFVSNVTEALLGAGCVLLLLRRSLKFDSLVDVAVFLFAASLATFLSCFLDSAFVTLNRWGQSSYWEVWHTRLWTNLTSSLTFVPAIVTWRAAGFVHWKAIGRARLLEAAALAVSLLIVTLLVFDSRFSINAPPALMCLPLPFLLWAALRFGPAGISLSFALVASLVIWGTGHGIGPLGSSEPADDAFSVQLFLLFIGPATLCIAAALAERSRAEQSLRASDRRFHLVLRATRDAVYEHDLANGALSWSGHGLTQFGYTLDQCSEDFTSHLALIHPADAERVRRAAAAAIDGNEQIWKSEFRLRRADGSYAHVHEQGFIVRERTGHAVQMVGALTDITERRDADELSQRLAHASRLTAMGELAASIAHEINQPMCAILTNVGAAEMLLDAGDQGSTELRQILKDIRDDDLRASEVIRHIRGLATKRDAAFEPFELNELVEAAVRLVVPTMRKRGVVLRTYYGAKVRVHGDRIHIQQVLLNLLFNGADAMAATTDHRRLLTVTTSTKDDGFALVSVHDHGHGVGAEHLQRIFDSFFTTKKDGMGLGLSIARSLVDTHGGRIWAENNADGGATFRFTLPIDRQDFKGRQRN
ncbi:MAG TPA: MASE1 domain-containing protein [Casimicrobiaceae bacterium]|nr:MASE1 domain-containing protein [Casimicrobiaceae bacterium]